MYELSNQFIHHFNYLSLKSKKSAFSTAFRLFRAYQFIHYFDVFKNWAPVHTSPTVFAAVHTSLALFTGQFIHHFNLFSVHTLPLCFAHQFIHHFTARANTAPQTAKRPSVPAARRFAARANTVPQTARIPRACQGGQGMPRGSSRENEKGRDRRLNPQPRPSRTGGFSSYFEAVSPASLAVPSNTPARTLLAWASSTSHSPSLSFL